MDSPLESVVASLKKMARNDALLGRTQEEKALVNQWLQHGVDIFEATTFEGTNLRDLDNYLTSRVFLVGYQPSIADVFFFVCLHIHVSAMSFHEKQRALNLTRWFSCVQDHFQDVLSDIVFTRSLLY